MPKLTVISIAELLSLRKTQLLMECLYEQGIEETDMFARAMYMHNERAKALGYWDVVVEEEDGC